MEWWKDRGLTGWCDDDVLSDDDDFVAVRDENENENESIGPNWIELDWTELDLYVYVLEGEVRCGTSEGGMMEWDEMWIIWS